MSNSRPSFPYKIRSSRGVTLVELMVAMMLMVLIGLVLIGILGQSEALVSQGAAMMATHQKSRYSIDRIGPYVASAVDGTLRAVYYPEFANDPQIYDDRIRFNTTEDFLDPNYDPRGVWTPLVATPYFQYEIAFVPESPAPDAWGQIVLRKLDTDGVTPLSTPAPRVLAHQVIDFQVAKLSENGLEVRVTTFAERKAADGHIIRKGESGWEQYQQVESAIIPVPSGSY